MELYETGTRIVHAKLRLFAIAIALSFAPNVAYAATPAVAVGPQYDSTHAYVAPEYFDRFVASLVATFGGTTSKQAVVTVTPTPSSTMSQIVLTPAGFSWVLALPTSTTLSVPRRYSTGYLVTQAERCGALLAVRAAADLIVSPFNDPIGRDAIVQWPGGVNMQLYWHTNAPSYAPLRTIPEKPCICVRGESERVHSQLPCLLARKNNLRRRACAWD